MRTYMVLLMDDAKSCGVDLKTYKIAIDSFGLYLFLVDGTVVITSCLLTGWTGEALCNSLSTGIFEYKRGGSIFCGRMSNFILHFGLFLLKVFMIGGYAAWVVTLVYVFIVSTACIGSELSYIACGLGDTYVSDLFDIFSKKINFFEDVDIITFCAHVTRIRRELLYMSIGMITIVCGQVLFFAIVVDNHRAALIGLQDSRRTLDDTIKK